MTILVSQQFKVFRVILTASQVAAIKGSPEYRMAVRKNARLDEGRSREGKEF